MENQASPRVDPTGSHGDGENYGSERGGKPRDLPEEDTIVITPKLVAVVDDDESVRESLPDLLRSFGLEVESYASAEAFLDSGKIGRTGCVVLDVAMPGMSGPELQQELARRKQALPVVFITAQADERVRTMVLKQGASAFLIKPFSEEAILGAVKAALGEG